MFSKPKKVLYFYDHKIGTYQLEPTHVMKPLRIAMTDQLIRKYQLDQHMSSIDQVFAQIFNIHANQQKLKTFHSDQYVDLLKIVTPENQQFYADQLYRFNFYRDCPVMKRMYDYVLSYTTGSVANAAMLANGQAQYAINWSGGLHHAKQSEASGFCYVNDCVLAIMELLKTYQRVLYIDIDVHHGDGVQQAFYLTDRVMTCSFHQFGSFFPGTGDLRDTGLQRGQNHSVNVPLKPGLTDDNFKYIFNTVITRIMQNFAPDAIVLQGGSDSLAGDQIGDFNLTVRGHGYAAQFLKTFNKPILFLGGGGYTLKNVPRCWTYETSLITGVEIANQIPQNQYSIYFFPENTIHLPPSHMDNQNKSKYIESTTNSILQNLSKIHRPGVQLNIHQSEPLKVNVTEVVRERRDRWQQDNMDKSKDGYM